MDKQNGNDWLTIGTPRCGLLMGACGIAIAFMLIFMGLWKTLFVAALFVAGYWLGANRSKSDKIKHTINKLFPPKGE